MFSANLLLDVTLIYLSLFISLSVSETSMSNDDLLHRSRRQLLFPNSTVLQFNAGVGTPTPAKMVNLNYAIQANFQLPWNRSQIPIDLLEANAGYDGLSRKQRDANGIEVTEKRDGDYESDAKLYHFYKYVEDILNSFGYNGTACVLQTLCQLGAEPLHSEDEEDLLHEVASFVLNPTNDAFHGLSEKDKACPYIEAHRFGQNNEDCSTKYRSCSTSLIDTFTKLHDVL